MHRARTLLSFAIGVCAAPAAANDVQPLLYQNVPVGTSFWSLGFSNSRGEVTVDNSIPVRDAEGDINTYTVSYARALDLGGRSALLTVVLPYVDLAFEGLFLGQPASTDRVGRGDPRVRLAVNLYGAPALDLDEYRAWQQRTILGASVEVSMPLGRYQEERIINIGSNRWSMTAQLGGSHRIGPFTVEGAVGGVWFTDNTDVLGSGRLSQDPMGVVRASARWHFGRGAWLGAAVLYTNGGRTTIDGLERDDELDNWRSGVAVSVPLSARHRIQLLATEGVTARIGSDFTTYAVTWTYTRFRR
jgi:hypothetical protein